MTVNFFTVSNEFIVKKNQQAEHRKLEITIKNFYHKMTIMENFQIKKNYS